MSENELLDVGGGGRFRVGSMLRGRRRGAGSHRGRSRHADSEAPVVVDATVVEQASGMAAHCMARTARPATHPAGSVESMAMTAQMHPWRPRYAWERWEARLVKALGKEPGSASLRRAIECIRELRQEWGK